VGAVSWKASPKEARSCSFSRICTGRMTACSTSSTISPTGPSGVGLLIVGTARPELLARRPGWGGGKRNASTVTVSALAPDETATLLAGLLDQVLLPAEVQGAVLKRTEGNPLFAEEYVRMLQDRGFLVQTGGGWQLDEREQLPLRRQCRASLRRASIRWSLSTRSSSRTRRCSGRSSGRARWPP